MSMTASMRAVPLMVCLVLPWLSPPAWGPSPSVIPWLTSLACAAALWGFLLPKISAGGSRAAVWAPLIAAAWLAAALVSSVIALCQYFGLAHHFPLLMSAASPGHAFANLRQPNQFASLTMIGGASLLWWASNGMARRYALPAIVLLALANAATASRIGLLQLAVLTLCVAAWPGPMRRHRLSLCLAAWVAYLAASLLLPPALGWVIGEVPANVWANLAGGPDCGSRLLLWSNVLHLIAQKPWLGWGWGELDYAHYVTLYPGGRFCDILDNAHNLPLHLAVEHGILIAALACLGMLRFALRRAPWRETDLDRQMAWMVLAVIMLHSMVEYPLWYGPFQMAFVVCVFLLWPLPKEAEAVRSQPRISTAWRVSAAAAVTAACVYAGWDYWRISQIYLPYPQRSAAYRDDTLAKIDDTRLFRNQVRFAELTLTPLSPDNAANTARLASELLHFSPEPRVIEPLIESLVMLGRDDEAMAHLARFRAAFPDRYQAWREANARPGP